MLIWDIIKTGFSCIFLELLQQVLPLGVTISRNIPKHAPDESQSQEKRIFPTLLGVHAHITVSLIILLCSNQILSEASL